MEMNDLEEIAKAYSGQAVEWMKRCPLDTSCPAATIFMCIIVQQKIIEGLRDELRELSV